MVAVLVSVKYLTALICLLLLEVARYDRELFLPKIENISKTSILLILAVKRVNP